MTKYGLRARVMTLTLAPSLIIGLLLSAFFSYNRYHDLEIQVVNAGAGIIEPLAIASEQGLVNHSRESVRSLISYAHRKNSKVVRSIAVFDANHDLFVTSNFHPNFDALTFPKDKPIPYLSSSDLKDDTLILRTPIIAESQLFPSGGEHTSDSKVLGYIAVELDLSSLRLQQYQEVFFAFLVLIFGLVLAGFFAYRLMHDVTRPISHMQNMVDRIRRGHLDVRIEGKMHGELDSLKNGINAMAVSLSEYHVEMQHSIDQATSDLRETLEQLEIQNVELDIAKKRAQEAARVKSEFLANMSHELRTPLNGVIGFTRQMLKTQLTNSQTDYLQTIEKSANNLLTIINDILDFSKLEAGKLALENIPFEFQDSLEEVVALQATSAHEKGLELTLKVDPKIPTGLVGDPLRIQQILTNLIGNSIKFTEKGNIDISVELKSTKEDRLEIQFMVRDTGIGISERQQAQLFQAFSQADASISRRYGGTGLGLVITQKLVGQMGGEISLTSRLHQGSTFWFTLKLLSTDIPMIAPLDLTTVANKHLLLIEPNAQAATVIQQTLTQEKVDVTYHSALPETLESYDYIILCLPPNEEIPLHVIEEWITRCNVCTSNVIIGTPSTQLALSDYLMQNYDVQCLTKPLSRKRLLQSLVDKQPQQMAPPVEVERVEKRPIQVMAVDDNLANLKLITALLSERVHTVISCDSGIVAIEKAQQQKFDMIFMDIQMPKMDGVTACKHIKTTEYNHSTPVIAVTAHAMSGERDRLLSEGMDDYLTKPIDEAMLENVMNKWVPLSHAPWSELLLESSITTDTILPSLAIETQDNKVIDWQAALRQSANKEDLAIDMLTMLVDYIPEVYRISEQVLDHGYQDREDVIHHIHKLHGSCSYSGVPRLKAICATIEKTLRSGEPLEDIEPELFELQEEMDKVVEAAPLYISK